MSLKHAYQFARYSGSNPKSVVFIVGCQRSGTTLATRIFERDRRARVFAEVSSLSSRDAPKHLRLDPLDEVEASIAKIHAEMVVLKPLVESQNTQELLDHFGGTAVWMYRGYRAVIDSIIRKWGPSHAAKDLASIAENRENDWRSEKVPEALRDLVLEFYAPGMDPHTAGSLYWYLRNSLVFSERFAHRSEDRLLPL